MPTFVEMMSTGNSTDFGVLTASRANAGAVSSGIRGIYAGGEPATDLIQYITIASTGNAQDFGDVAIKSYSGGGCSDSHGGLGGF